MLCSVLVSDKPLNVTVRHFTSQQSSHSGVLGWNCIDRENNPDLIRWQWSTAQFMFSVFNPKCRPQHWVLRLAKAVQSVTVRRTKGVHTGRGEPDTHHWEMSLIINQYISNEMRIGLCWLEVSSQFLPRTCCCHIVNCEIVVVNRVWKQKKVDTMAPNHLNLPSPESHDFSCYIKYMWADSL